MKKLLLVILATCMVLVANSQNYRFFDNDYSVYKSDVEGFYYPNQTLGIDTIGSIYYYEFQKMVNNSAEPYFYNVNGPGFLGQFAQWDTANNIYYFHNKMNDTILFYTSKPQGYSWIAYEKESETVTAYVSNVEVDIVNEIADTIKTISFSCNGIQDQYNVSDENIIVSSQRGLLHTINFGSFPYLYDQYISSVFNLIEDETTYEMFNPIIIDSISRADFYDLNVGDELHIDESYMGYDFPPQLKKSKLILKVLNREESESFISLKYYRKYKSWIDYEVNNQYIDTINLNYNKNPMYGMPPYRYEGSENDCELRNISITHDRLQVFKPMGVFMKHNETDWEFLHYDFGDTEYGITGLGDGYYAGGIFGDDYRKLVYYNVSGEEWGTPLNFTVGMNDIELESLKVYPNPVNDRLIINSSNLNSEADLMVFDMSGKTIINRKIQQWNSQIELNVSNLNSGVYTIQIVNGQQILTNKFIKLE